MPGLMRQIYASAVASLGIFGLGLTLGWTAETLEVIKKDFELDQNEKSWVASIAMLGALVASPISGWSVDRFGRKFTLMFFALPNILGWVILHSATSVFMLYAGRFITGFCGGVYSLVTPIYICETTEDHIRGILNSGYQIMLNFGLLFVYVLGAYLDWKLLSLICTFCPTAIFILTISLPDSPRYLLNKGKEEKALNALIWLRGGTSNPAIELEMSEIRTSLQENIKRAQNKESLKLKDFTSIIILKPVAISVGLMIFEAFSGFTAVTFFTVQIFNAAGQTKDSDLYTIIVGVVGLASAFASAILVDKIGRRVLLLTNQFLMAVSLLGLGTFFYLLELKMTKGLGLIPLISLGLFIIAFNVGVGPLSTTMMGEIIPQKVKGFMTAVSTANLWFLSFVVTNVFERWEHLIGNDICFWFFSGTCMVGFVVIYLWVPETKGKSLEEIQLYFAKKPKIGTEVVAEKGEGTYTPTEEPSVIIQKSPPSYAEVNEA